MRTLSADLGQKMENVPWKTSPFSAPEARINARLIEQMPIDDLKPYLEHVRSHSKKQIDDLN